MSDTKLGQGPVSSWSNKGVACFAIALPPLGLVGNRIVVRLSAAGYSKTARAQTREPDLSYLTSC